ncbi:MAG: CdvA-like protein [Nitrososphaerales archaeon]|jgi:hypothetical protein
MRIDDPSALIGRAVRDVYGRDLGKCVGFTLDLGAKVSAIGVQSGLWFYEYPADCITSNEKDVVVMPEWKMHARRFGLERGTLDKRMKALNALLSKGEISHRVYDDLSRTLSPALEGHERLADLLERRLEELEDVDDKISSFMARVMLEGVSEELKQDVVKRITDYCMSAKLMNGSEKLDLTGALDVIRKEPVAQHPVEDEEEQPEVTRDQMVQHGRGSATDNEDDAREEAEESQVAAGSLRSLVQGKKSDN